MIRNDADADDVALVARVQARLAGGEIETWLAPLRLSDDALSYTAEVYLPEGAEVEGVTVLKRPAGTRQEVVIARSEVPE